MTSASLAIVTGSWWPPRHCPYAIWLYLLMPFVNVNAVNRGNPNMCEMDWYTQSILNGLTMNIRLLVLFLLRSWANYRRCVYCMKINNVVWQNQGSNLLVFRFSETSKNWDGKVNFKSFFPKEKCHKVTSMRPISKIKKKCLIQQNKSHLDL